MGILAFNFEKVIASFLFPVPFPVHHIKKNVQVRHQIRSDCRCENHNSKCEVPGLGKVTGNFNAHLIFMYVWKPGHDQGRIKVGHQEDNHKDYLALRLIRVEADLTDVFYYQYCSDVIENTDKDSKKVWSKLTPPHRKPLVRDTHVVARVEQILTEVSCTFAVALIHSCHRQNFTILKVFLSIILEILSLIF